MRIFITGAGLLGLYATRRLLPGGHQVTFYDRAPNEAYIATVVDPAAITVLRGDTTDQPALYRAIRDTQPDVIIHTAALIGMRAGQNINETFRINVEATMTVAEAAATFGVPRVVYCSTNGVYDFTAPVPPEGITELYPVGSGSPYGNSKLAAEQLLIAAGRKFGLTVISLRFSSVYGRGHFLGGSWIGQTIDDLLHAALEGRELRFRPSFQSNEYTYIKDVAAALEAAATGPAPRDAIFNIGTGVVTSPTELVRAIGTAVPGSRIELDPDYAQAAQEIVDRGGAYNLTRARDQLGYEPRYPLAEGLADYAAEVRAGRALDEDNRVRISRAASG